MLRFVLPLTGCLFAVFALADDAFDGIRAQLSGGQLFKNFEVLIHDSDEQPIKNVTVTPWALRSSQGHGRWNDGDEFAEMSPVAVTTDAKGVATIRYPFYRNVKEETRTFSVSVNLSHPDFTIADSIHIDVPLLDDEPKKIEMVRAAQLEFIPESSAQDFETAQIHVVSSDRSTALSKSIKRTTDRVRLETLSPGPFRAMLVRLVDGQATAFSEPIELKLKSGQNKAIKAVMHPAIDIRGRLGDEVPRPVIAGRVCAIASPRKHPLPNFDWAQWAPVDEDGEFVIKGYPRSEPLQVIALCDHFIARNGRDPNAKPKPDDPSKPDFFGGLKAVAEIAEELTRPSHRPCSRPQTFASNPQQPILIRMSPLVRCQITVVNPDNDPLSNVLVGASPNVFWWDWGSQVYGDSLMRSTEWLTGTTVEEPWYSDSVRGYDMPFFEYSDAKGESIIYLPPGKQSLFVYDKADGYQLPIFMGRRDCDVTVVAGEKLSITLQLEPPGVESLGEYDKLAGVVFGCSTREGKQICALPEVRERMNDFARRLREADDPRDPVVLAEAYTVVAEAFDRAGDKAEADRWRSKAEAQKAKLEKLP
ncbi:hypothetical protein CA13_55480 [Planctomycetes bacterium CA13]|uniref:Uncharacterized protein n=1 Tax=Novipirellula herctigrandis TaxID=2527986 RepID=A0A5C5Z9R9_9BACT|nr:hypothetical protein CA13_55480 [Planctomycetes bacterium CA13]